MSRYTQTDELRQRRSRLLSALPMAATGLTTLLGGLAIGAGVMYLLDPDEGHRRRRYIRRSASGALHSAGDVIGSAYGTVADSASSLRDRASNLRGSAGRLLHRSADYADEYVGEEEGVGTGTLLTLVLGGSAVAAMIYMLTSEYDTLRRGDFRGAASHVYQRASDAVSSSAQFVRDKAGDVADRAGEYMGRTQEQVSQ